MSNHTEEPMPDDVPEADFAEQHQLADGDTDDHGDAVPDVDLDTEANLADVQEQATPVPVDDEDEPR